MSLASVCAEIAHVVADPASGIVDAHNEPPEMLGKYPASWVNPTGGRLDWRVGDKAWLHAIELIVYVTPRVANLPVEFARVAPLVNSVEQVISNAYLANEFSPGIDRCVVASYSIGIRDFGGKPQHCVTFTLDVKEHTT